MLELEQIRCTKCPYSHRPRSIRCIDLYDTRKNHPFNEWRVVSIDSSTMDNKNICLW